MRYILNTEANKKKTQKQKNWHRNARVLNGKPYINVSLSGVYRILIGNRLAKVAK